MRQVNCKKNFFLNSFFWRQRQPLLQTCLRGEKNTLDNVTHRHTIFKKKTMSCLYAYQLSLLTAIFEKTHLDGEPFRQRFAVFQDFCFSSRNKALVKVYSIILIDTHTWLLSIVVNHGFEFTRENESSTTFWGACRLKTVRGLSLTNCKSIKFGTYKYFRAQRLISENHLL